MVAKKKKPVKKPAVKKPAIPTFADDGMEWISKSEAVDFVKGDILRVLVDDKEFPENYGKTFYSVCSGAGFGCHASSLGNCIYVYGMSVFSDLSKTIEAKKKLQSMNYNTGGYDRWERFWTLQVLSRKPGGE